MFSGGILKLFILFAVIIVVVVGIVDNAITE